MNNKMWLMIIALPFLLVGRGQSWASTRNPNIMHSNSAISPDSVLFVTSAGSASDRLFLSARDDQTVECLRTVSCKE